MPSESNICEVTFIVAILDPMTLELEVMELVARQDARIQKLLIASGGNAAGSAYSTTCPLTPSPVELLPHQNLL